MDSMSLGKSKLNELRPKDAIPAFNIAREDLKKKNDAVGVLECEAYLSLAEAMEASLRGDSAKCTSKRAEALECPDSKWC